MNQDLCTKPTALSTGYQEKKAVELGSAAQTLYAHANAMPQKLAIRDSRADLTWSELAGAVSALSLRLQQEGVTSGSPVLLLTDTCIESIVAYWAVRSLEAVAIIADPGCTRREFDHYVAVTEPGWVFSTRPGTWERLQIDAVPTTGGLTWLLQEGEPSVGWLRPWTSRTTQGRPRPDRFETVRGARLVLFSSGTTGIPKAIVHTDASIEALNRLHAASWGLTPDDVVLGSLPFHTIYGSIYTAASTLYNGATLGLMERFKPELALQRMQSWGITTAAMVPTMLTMMLNVDNRHEFDLSSLRAIYVGAAPISDSTIDDFSHFAGVPVLGSYGLTECPGAAVEPSGKPHTSHAAGRICDGFKAVARDSRGNPLVAGDTGEITLQGPTTMLGYLGQPELTSQRIRDGWVYTQDIGHVDRSGNIFISGRATDMIIRGGLNIAPKEIEDVLVQHHGVTAAAAVGIPDEVYGQIVKAFIVPRCQSDLDGLADELRQHCLTRLNRAKAPQEIVFVRDFPMNAGGKVLRDELTGDRVTELIIKTGTERLEQQAGASDESADSPSPRLED